MTIDPLAGSSGGGTTGGTGNPPAAPPPSGPSGPSSSLAPSTVSASDSSTISSSFPSLVGYTQFIQDISRNFREEVFHTMKTDPLLRKNNHNASLEETKRLIANLNTALTLFNQAVEAIAAVNAILLIQQAAALALKTAKENAPPPLEKTIDTFNAAAYDPPSLLADDQAATDALNTKLQNLFDAYDAMQANNNPTTQAAYSQATTDYNNAAAVYATYANDRNQTLAPLVQDANQVINPYNDSRGEGTGSLIDNLNFGPRNPPIPYLPAATPAASMPPPLTAGLGNALSFPPPRTQFFLPAREELPAFNYDEKITQWWNQVLALKNGSPTPLSTTEYAQLRDYYNNLVTPRNNAVQPQIDAYNAAVDSYNGAITPLISNLQALNQQLVIIDLPTLAVPPSSLSHFTGLLTPASTEFIANVSQIPNTPFTVPTIPTGQPAVEVGNLQDALNDLVKITTNGMIQDIMQLIDLVAQLVKAREKKQQLLRGFSVVEPAAFVRIHPEVASSLGAGGSLSFGLFAVDPASDLLGGILSKAGFNALLKKALIEDPLRNNLAEQLSGIATVFSNKLLGESSLRAISPTLNILANSLGTLPLNSFAIPAASALSSLSQINELVNSTELNELIYGLVKTTLGEAGLTTSEESVNLIGEGSTNLIKEYLLQKALVQASVALGLPELLPLVLGNVAGVSPLDIQLASHPKDRFGEVFRSPLAVALLAENLTSALVKGTSLSNGEANLAVINALKNVLGQQAVFGPLEFRAALISALVESGVNPIFARVLGASAVEFVKGEIALPGLEAALKPSLKGNLELADRIANGLGGFAAIGTAALTNPDIISLRQFRDGVFGGLLENGVARPAALRLANESAQEVFKAIQEGNAFLSPTTANNISGVLGILLEGQGLRASQFGPRLNHALNAFVNLNAFALAFDSPLDFRNQLVNQLEGQQFFDNNQITQLADLAVRTLGISPLLDLPFHPVPGANLLTKALLGVLAIQGLDSDLVNAAVGAAVLSVTANPATTLGQFLRDLASALGREGFESSNAILLAQAAVLTVVANAIRNGVLQQQVLDAIVKSDAIKHDTVMRTILDNLLNGNLITADEIRSDILRSDALSQANTDGAIGDSVTLENLANQVLQENLQSEAIQQNEILKDVIKGEVINRNVLQASIERNDLLRDSVKASSIAKNALDATIKQGQFNSEDEFRDALTTQLQKEAIDQGVSLSLQQADRIAAEAVLTGKPNIKLPSKEEVAHALFNSLASALKPDLGQLKAEEVALRLVAAIIGAPTLNEKQASELGSSTSVVSLQNAIRDDFKKLGIEKDVLKWAEDYRSRIHIGEKEIQTAEAFTDPSQVVANQGIPMYQQTTAPSSVFGTGPSVMA